MPDAIWYVGVRGERKGPFSEDDIKGMVQKGEVSPADVVWKEGMDNWKPVREVDPFIEVAKSVPTPPPAPPMGPNPALDYLKGFGNDLLGILKAPDTGTAAAADKKDIVTPAIWIVLGILTAGLLGIHGAGFGRGLLRGLIEYAVTYGFTILALVAILRTKATWIDILSIIGLAAIPTVLLGIVGFALLWAHFFFHVLVQVAEVLQILLFAHLLQHTSQVSKRVTLYCVPAIYLASMVVMFLVARAFLI